MHILLIANVSQSYFNQRLAAAQLQVANDTLQNYQQSYAFVEKTAADREHHRAGAGAGARA